MKKVIFDVDGVLLSEERYYDVSALTVWEILYGRQYMGLPSEREDFDASAVTDGQIAAIRSEVWGKDSLLSWLKQRGINSNWDMVHAWLITCFWLFGREYRRRTGGDVLPLRFEKESDFHEAGLAVMGLPVPKASDLLAAWESAVPAGVRGSEVFAALAEAMKETFGDVPAWAGLQSALWRMHTEAFQAWYLGDDLFIEKYHRLPAAGGKRGFLRNETPLAPAAAIGSLFRRLKENGWEIAVATGRSRHEMEVPFRTLGWYGEFDPLYLATASDAFEAEQLTGVEHLDKPHPFIYECAMYGRKRENYGDYAKGLRKPAAGDAVYVVGDSYSDILGAAAAGARCIGVLTGLEGKEAAAMFEKAGVPCADRVTEIEPFLK